MIKTVEDYKNAIPDKGVCVVEFGSPVCCTCKLVKSQLEKLDKDFPDVTVVYVNVLECDTEVPVYAGIVKIPTVLVYRDGEKDESVGKKVDIKALRKLCGDVPKSCAGCKF